MTTDLPDDQPPADALERLWQSLTDLAFGTHRRYQEDLDTLDRGVRALPVEDVGRFVNSLPAELRWHLSLHGRDPAAAPVLVPNPGGRLEDESDER